MHIKHELENENEEDKWQQRARIKDQIVRKRNLQLKKNASSVLS